MKTILVSLKRGFPYNSRLRAGMAFTKKALWYEVEKDQLQEINEDQHLVIYDNKSPEYQEAKVALEAKPVPTIAPKEPTRPEDAPESTGGVEVDDGEATDDDEAPTDEGNEEIVPDEEFTEVVDEDEEKLTASKIKNMNKADLLNELSIHGYNVNEETKQETNAVLSEKLIALI